MTRPFERATTRRRFVQGLAAGGVLAGAGACLPRRSALGASVAEVATLRGREIDLVIGAHEVNLTGATRTATLANGAVVAARRAAILRARRPRGISMSKFPPVAAVAALALALAAPNVARAQAPRASPPLPALPQVYETADQKVRVVKLADGLSNPWSLAWLPNGDLLITERAGRLRLFHDGKLDPTPIAGVPEVRITALGGLLEVLPHPKFAQNGLVYLSYSKGGEGNLSTTALARGKLVGKEIQGLKDVFVAKNWSNSPTNFGGRMVFGKDGMLYLTVGERQEPERAQNTLEHGGKVLRLTEDGKAPPDNPFIGRKDYLPEIYSVGHRSPQGLVFHPITGELWENEHGPLGGDEINIVKAGKNYGWPLVTYGRDYDGKKISDLTTRPDLESPFMYFVPSIAISGMTFYTGDKLKAWKGNAFVGSMMEGRTNWTGHIRRITFSDDGQPIQREPILRELRQRIRDVRMGPDELLYVLTDENPGVMLRIEPAG